MSFFGALQPKALLHRSRCYLRPGNAAFNVFSRPALLSGIDLSPPMMGSSGWSGPIYASSWWRIIGI